MPRQLPSLDWLRVFATTAASESFTLAATELSVTPGAVSQRIKALEAFLGVELFQRYPQGVRLTDVGRRYAGRVIPSLEHLTQATAELISADPGAPVRMSVLPAFAQLWLGPRLDEFHRRNATATIEIWADPIVVDLRAAGFDIAIRYGKPPFPGCKAIPLLQDDIVPVAAPAVIEGSERDANGLPVNVPLMLDSYWSKDFDDWLERTGTERPAAVKVQTFSLYNMVLDATLAGRGFMMGHTSLVGDHIADGRLVPLSDKRVPARNQFYLLTQEGAGLSPAATAFLEWIMDAVSPADADPSSALTQDITP